MTAWFIIGPKGGVYRDCTGQRFCHATKRGCIVSFTWTNCMFGKTHDEVWSEYQSLGYRCEKRRVVE